MFTKRFFAPLAPCLVALSKLNCEKGRLKAPGMEMMQSSKFWVFHAIQVWNSRIKVVTTIFASRMFKPGMHLTLILAPLYSLWWSAWVENIFSLFVFKACDCKPDSPLLFDHLLKLLCGNVSNSRKLALQTTANHAKKHFWNKFCGLPKVLN